MRLKAMRAALVGLAGAVAAAAGGCVPVYSGASGTVEVVRIDPEDAAERAAIGAVLGAALGTGFGATAAINPALGAIIGIEVGSAVGAGIGAITAQPLPTYAPVVVPADAVIPGFYDAWPPGYHAPPIPAATPPPTPQPSPS